MVLRLYRYNRIINIIIILFIIIFTINYSLFFKANIKIPMINPKKTIPYNGFLMKSIKRSLILSPVKYAVSFNNSKNNIGILKIIFIIFFVLSKPSLAIFSAESASRRTFSAMLILGNFYL